MNDSEDLLNHQATRFAFVAGFTILVYDIVLTLAAEITRVWGHRWSLGKALFFLNRYIPPIVLAVNMYSALCDPSANLNVCHTYFVISAVFNILCIAIVQVILALRTYALYLTNFALLLFLMLLPTLLVMGLGVWMYVHWVVADPIAATSASGDPGCFNVHCTGGAMMCRAVWIIMNCLLRRVRHRCVLSFSAPGELTATVILALTVFKYFQIHRLRHESNAHLEPELGRVLAAFESTFLKTLFQDGFLFYAAIAAIAIANITLMSLAPSSLMHVLAGPTQALRSTLCSRLFLNLRLSHQEPRSLPSLGSSTCLPFEPITFSSTRR
ncbi:hypothetical protein BDZ89DRAFT_1173788 [Hymenopellis radicata]|nr:hypothetical protein BDZ89DRAFT_1173788 [Hymenopellis radicata]